jgi:hypothetical protein
MALNFKDSPNKPLILKISTSCSKIKFYLFCPKIYFLFFVAISTHNRNPATNLLYIPRKVAIAISTHNRNPMTNLLYKPRKILITISTHNKNHVINFLYKPRKGVITISTKIKIMRRIFYIDHESCRHNCDAQ